MTPRVAGRPTAPVTESWARIERWLERHMPAVRATLAPGATARTLAKFEEAIGQPLPADVRESWRIHDGQRSAWGVPGASPADLERCVREEGWVLGAR